MGTKGYGVGGEGNTDWPCQNVCYEYDLTGNSWTTKTAMPSVGCIAACAYIDGYAFAGQEKADAHKYDISANSWSTLTYALSGGSGSLPPPLGGYIYLGTTKYDFANDSYRGCLQRHSMRQRFKVGGYHYAASSTGDGTNNASKYDPAADWWSYIANTPANRQQGCAFADNVQYGFLAQGNDYPSGSLTGATRRYDTSANSWAERASSPNATVAPTSFYIDGCGHAFCGASGWENKSGNSGHARYDNAANTWTGKAAYPQAMKLVGGFAPVENFPPNAPTGLSVAKT